MFSAGAAPCSQRTQPTQHTKMAPGEQQWNATSNISCLLALGMRIWHAEYPQD